MLEYYLELALLIKIPDFVPIYTENGIKVQNPAVGYYDLMFAPICYDEPQGLLGAACPWSHQNEITFVDNEYFTLFIPSIFSIERIFCDTDSQLDLKT